MRVALVIGARPRIIKSAPVVHAVGDFPEVELLIVHAGQHYDYAINRRFFNELVLPGPLWILYLEGVLGGLWRPLSFPSLSRPPLLWSVLLLEAALP